MGSTILIKLSLSIFNNSFYIYIIYTMSKTLKFKNTLYNIIDSGDIGNGWKYVEVIDKKQAFSLPKCLYYKGKSMKNLLSYTDYVNHLDMGKGFINDFVKDIFRECYPGSKNPICKVKESLMVGGADKKLSLSTFKLFVDIITTKLKNDGNTGSLKIEDIFKNIITNKDFDVKYKQYFKDNEKQILTELINLIKKNPKNEEEIEKHLKNITFISREGGDWESEKNKIQIKLFEQLKQLKKVKDETTTEEEKQEEKVKLEDVKLEQKKTEEKEDEEEEDEELKKCQKIIDTILKKKLNSKETIKELEKAKDGYYFGDCIEAKTLVDNIINKIKLEEEKDGEEDEAKKRERINMFGRAFNEEAPKHDAPKEEAPKEEAPKEEAATEDNKDELPGYLDKLFKISGDKKDNLNNDTIVYFNIKNDLDVSDKLLHLNNEALFNDFLYQESERGDNKLYKEKLINLIKKIEIQKNDKYYKLESKEELKTGNPKIFRIIEKLIVRDIIQTKDKFNKHKDAYRQHGSAFLEDVDDLQKKEISKGRTLFRIEDKEAAKTTKQEEDGEVGETANNDGKEQGAKIETKDNKDGEGVKNKDEQATNIVQINSVDKLDEEQQKKDKEENVDTNTQEDNQDGNKEKNEEFKNKVKNAEVELDKKMRDDEKMKKNKDNADALNQLVLENNKNKKKIKVEG